LQFLKLNPDCAFAAKESQPVSRDGVLRRMLKTPLKHHENFSRTEKVAKVATSGSRKSKKESEISDRNPKNLDDDLADG